jgi:glycosyltransferase involved in cell wall biosynthesis
MQVTEATMKISIAMATYNGAQYLKAQLQSFTDQTRHPDELIITDDCSSDDTETIVRDFAQTAPFKVLFSLNEQNLGYCGNFNAALMKTTGGLVFLSDQDDVWFPGKIEHMIAVAERNPEALVVMNDAALTDEALNEVGLTKMGQIRSAGLQMDSFVMGCCCAVRRELLDICMPIPAGLKGHDNWLVVLADGLNSKVIDTRVLQYYRRHESNESQFIANRTTKVTRTDEFILSLRNLFQKDFATQTTVHLSQLVMFADGVHEVSLKAPERYRHQLVKLESRYRQRVGTTKNRAAVREKWLLPRIVAAGGLWMHGGYRNSSGLKSIIRDIVG